ncbi:MAG: hypothetical protein HFJ45_05265 [Clostridia bacterium]|nr:hypothetical protein [Clostridia bacterium]
MPSILLHLVFAQNVYRELSNKNIKFDRISFMAGNLIPDLAINHQKSHYWKETFAKGFFTPDMDLVKKDLFVIQDPIKFGLYSHLYLDKHFIEDFLINEFIWDYKKMIVINPRNNMMWNVTDFFSQNGMYGSYKEISLLLLQNNLISIQTIEEIPEFLPKSGINFFDVRRKKTWKIELYEYLEEKKVYTGNIFEYNRICNSIQHFSRQFINEI